MRQVGKKTYRHRSAVSGKFITKERAATKPDRSVRERVRRIARSIAPDPAPKFPASKGKAL